MSEVINGQYNTRLLRWRLLATASVFALLGNSIGVANASDDESDHPIVWLELGGQFDVLEDPRQKLDPPFFAKVADAGFTSPLSLEKAPRFVMEESAKFSFTPENSDWIFSASVRYGRSGSKAYKHEETNNPSGGLFRKSPSNARFRYAETSTNDTETHDILDFMAGRDFGLGAFGRGGTSILSGGIRFAQFRSKSGMNVYSDPDYTNPNSKYHRGGPKYFHNFSASSHGEKSFTGVGPSISWDASTMLVGQAQNGEITLDWGLNGAVLFGRQKSVGYHQTKGKLFTGYNIPPLGKYYNTKHYTHAFPQNRSRMVAVPNVGAAAGLSFRYADAKVSFGYRADMFFGAMDGGLDTGKRENVGFYGPFASVSVGMGG
jgi:iron complex outermembrane receptor protein